MENINHTIYSDARNLANLLRDFCDETPDKIYFKIYDKLRLVLFVQAMNVSITHKEYILEIHA